MKMKVLLIRFWSSLSFLLTMGTILFLFLFVFIRGASAVTWTFLTDSPRGLIIGTEGGILPAIVGSLWYTIIASLVAALLGISTAIYQVYYCQRGKLSSLISLVMQCMAGVPSIVIGLFGYSFFVLQLGWGKSLLSGGLTQAIMILPFIQVRAEKALREMDTRGVRASYALGISKSHTIRHIVLPQCRGQLVSAVLLGACYAMGAAAPLIFTGAVILSKVPMDIHKPAMALPYHLYMLLTQGTSEQNAYGTAFVMMFLVLLSNSLASFCIRRKKNE